jgi:hypothetical protein
VCALIFSKSLSVLFLIQRDAIKCTWVFTWGIRYSCQISVELQFTQQIFEKYPNIKFNEILPVAGTDMKKLIVFFFFFLQFLEQVQIQRLQCHNLHKARN